MELWRWIYCEVLTAGIGVCGMYAEVRWVVLKVCGGNGKGAKNGLVIPRGDASLLLWYGGNGRL